MLIFSSRLSAIFPERRSELYFCMYLLTTGPLRERAPHEFFWIFPGGEHGSGWEHVSRCGCGLLDGQSCNLQVETSFMCHSFFDIALIESLLFHILHSAFFDFPPRARQVISITSDIKVSPREIDLTVKNCGNSIWCVFFCFLYTQKNHPKSILTPNESVKNSQTTESKDAVFRVTHSC